MLQWTLEFAHMKHRLPEDGGEQEGRWTGRHAGIDSNQRPGVHHQADGMSPDSLVPCARHAHTNARTHCVSYIRWIAWQTWEKSTAVGSMFASQGTCAALRVDGVVFATCPSSGPSSHWISATSERRRRKAREEMVVRERRVLILLAAAKCLFFCPPAGGKWKKIVGFSSNMDRLRICFLFPWSTGTRFALHWSRVQDVCSQALSNLLNALQCETVTHLISLITHELKIQSLRCFSRETSVWCQDNRWCYSCSSRLAKTLCQYAAPELCFFSLKQWWLLSWQLLCWLICSRSRRGTCHQLWILTASTKTAFEGRCAGLSCLRDWIDGTGRPPGTLHNIA